jgi:hypothetical protein
MAEVEPYLVQLIIQFSNMRIPISCAQGLELANSLISGTEVEKKLIEWKSNNCYAYKHASVSGDENKKLGLGYWRSFLRRNEHLIRTKKAVKFDNKHAEWCTYDNIQEMYDEIYQNLCSAGLACKHPEPLWRDENGEVVEEHKAYGLVSHYELIHLDWLLFVDECRSNTSQTKDGQVSGQRILCSVDRRPQQRAATKDAHFTVLGFMAASEEAVMCAVIFAAKSFRHEW